jgi:hypothetical protein
MSPRQVLHRGGPQTELCQATTKPGMNATFRAASSRGTWFLTTRDGVEGLIGWARGY